MRLVVDTFPFNNELDLLQCRLEEMSSAVDYFVAVEADVDHQDHPKPYTLAANLDRFKEWADQLVVVQATGLPTMEADADPWARELAQREYVFDGLREVEQRAGRALRSDDLILHGDVDEICRPLYVRNVRPKDGFVTLEQDLHCFAVDWLHPDPWGGTVAGTWQQIQALGDKAFQKMRNTRNSNPALPFAGWHLSWLGGHEAALKKLGSFCHPEIAERTLSGLTTDLYLREGLHVDGRRMTPVNVDETWPRMIFERRCPEVWFRPRDGESELAGMYADRCRTPSDINLHLPRMVELVETLNAQHVIELGTRTGVSTVAWLYALEKTGGQLTSVDIDRQPPIGEWTHWTFIQGDDCAPDVIAGLEPADVVFIDTSHHYEHTCRELRAYLPLLKKGGVICLHDTELQWPEGASPADGPFPVKRAVTEFCAEHGFEWINFPESWGFGIVKVR